MVVGPESRILKPEAFSLAPHRLTVFPGVSAAVEHSRLEVDPDGLVATHSAAGPFHGVPRLSRSVTTSSEIPGSTDRNWP